MLSRSVQELIKRLGGTQEIVIAGSCYPPEGLRRGYLKRKRWFYRTEGLQ